jgi:predicted permease
LRAGETSESAALDLTRIARSIHAAEPASRYSYGIAVEPLQDHVVGSVRVYLRLLMGAVGFVLLVACANIAGINFARAQYRVNEVAVRMALGAGRRRVMVQLITEQVIVALAGGTLGIVLAWFLLGRIAAGMVDILPRAGAITLDARVLAFACCTSLAAGLLAAIVPTWRASGAAPRQLMGARGITHGRHSRTGALVVGLEVAVAVLLVSGGALLLRSFRSLLSHELGFDSAGVVTAQIILDTPAYTAAARVPSFWDALIEDARSIPGVRAVGLTNAVPAASAYKGFIEVEGSQDRNAGAGYRIIDGGYFRTIGTSLRSGRTFNASDRPGVNRGVVVNEAMAARYWPGTSPLGRRVRALSMEGYSGTEPAWLTVIGVVADIRQFGYEHAAEPEMFVHARDVPNATRAMFIALRTSPGSEVQVRTALAALIRRHDAELAPDIATLDDRLGGLLVERRMILSVLSAFGVLALALAAIGIYALLSFTVGQRTREIGIRIALGSSADNVVSLIMKSTGLVIAAGAAFGLLLALWLSRLMASLLVDISHTDPGSYVMALAAVVLAAIAAAAVPALRAVHVDPLSAMRED